jgi:hypothetical protein
MGVAGVRVPTYFAAVFLLIAAAAVHAQAQNTSPTRVAPSDAPRVYRTTESRIAIGRSIRVAHDEEVQDAVVVIGGSLRVDGRVRNDVVVIGGNLQLGSQSEVRGDAVVVGGGITREEGAKLHGRVSDVMIGDWAPFRIGSWSVPAFDFGDFGRWFALFGALFRVAFLGLLMVMILVVARAPVARIGHAAAAAPGRAFVTGFAAEILFIPALIVASIALAVTIIGIPLVFVMVPLAILLAAVAMVLGFTALATRLGEWLEDRAGFRGHSAFLAAALGLLIIVGPTLLARTMGVAPWPMRFAGFGLLATGIFIEFVVWTIGLGATLMTGFGRWSVVPPPIPPPAPAVPVVVNA